jgi:TAG lipase/steryl ester hydrolase/phospholipase A2/LPA acyltransferase
MHEECTCASILRALLILQAANYDRWRSAAMELDAFEGNDDWKDDPTSTLYDHQLLRARLKELKEATKSGDPFRMIFLLRTSLTRSLGNMGDLNLYRHSHIGTKTLIEDYIAAACDALDALLASLGWSCRSSDHRYFLDELLLARQAFGRSALLLSGGGTFGMAHSGVVKCLWESQLLPRIISGSSAGSIVSAVLCVKTDVELPATLTEFCAGDMEVFERGEESSFLRRAARLAKHGGIFDIENLQRVMRGLLGDLTFQEAYNRTRRILNISVSSSSIHELPRLLNYITAPNVIIWSAVAASCSVPLVYTPTKILAKNAKTGAEEDWNQTPQRWIDGSVEGDLPTTRLAEMFNVNHSIVSQVNPHVVPFLLHEMTGRGEVDDEAGIAGSGWFRTLGTLARDEVIHRMQVLAEMGIFPSYITKFRSVLSQKYSGDITIIPAIAYSQFPQVLRNPTPEFMMSAMHSGECATWPKLSRIKNHCAIELALDNAIQRLRTSIAFSPSQVDLRMLSLETSYGGEMRRGHYARSRNKTRSWCDYALASGIVLPMASLQQKRASRKRPAASLHEAMPPTDSESDDEEAYLTLAMRRGRAIKVDPLDFYDSSESNVRSYSPSSEPGSPDFPPQTTARLPPSNKPLFPHTSQPSTPYTQGGYIVATGGNKSSRPSAAALAGSQLALTMSMPQPDVPNPTGEPQNRKGVHSPTSIPRYGRKLLDIGGMSRTFLRKKKRKTDGA